MVDIKVNGKIVGMTQTVNMLPTSQSLTGLYNIVLPRVILDKDKVASFSITNDFARSQMLPLQIGPWVNDDGDTQEIENVWISKIEYSYVADDVVIVSGVECQCENISVKLLERMPELLTTRTEG